MKSLFLMIALFAFPVLALTVDTPLPSAEQESRAQLLFTELRCVVCQGEAIADSPADVARDMRNTVRELVAEGKSDEQVISYFVHQYGDKVLMMPSFSSGNLFLWSSPLLVLLLGAFIIKRSLFTGDKS